MRAALVPFLAILIAAMPARALDLTRPEGAIRIAVFNASLARKGAGKLIRDIETGGDQQVRNVAEIILRVRPDILILNEFDHDPSARALGSFRTLLAAGHEDLAGITYPHWHHDEVNTGVLSGHDLDGDGRKAEPKDAYGFGRFPGQYGMAVLSRYPLGDVQSYRLFKWAEMPGADRPVIPGGAPYHSGEVWADLRLSSKSHWNVAARLPDGREVNLLIAHPTPPVFDGPEDLNGRRNADEIRFLIAMLDGADWLRDDAGRAALRPELAIVAGDLNADPEDGEGHKDAISALLSHPELQDPAPESPGATDAARQGGGNRTQTGVAARDTADWKDKNGPGNLRVDYLLPTRRLSVLGSGVFWPTDDDPLARLVRSGRRLASSDHRLVWLDLAPAR
ncbi:MAG: endonuclease/exonuclease/phosphatase family protein [Pseudomonadota bacterium]